MSHSAELKGIWGSIGNSLSELSDAPDAWEQLRERTDFASFKPRRASGIEERRLESKREGEYYILKNPQAGTYLPLTDRDFYLWTLMDGTQSVSELVVAYFCKYNSFAFARVDSLIDQLRNNFFLTDQPFNTFDRIKGKLDGRTFSHKADTFWRSFQGKEFAIQNIDRYISKIYRAVGWIFFVKPMKILYMILSVLGAFFFVRQLNSGAYPILRIWNSYGLGFLTVLMIYLIIVLFHEAAHALTAKSYDRDIRKGGFMIYFGMPVFFVDTMDMWMESRRARIAASWAGPYLHIISGGLCSIVAAIFPEAPVSFILFRFAFFSYLLAFINLNPLLELDGYFILMDWLEIPLLRRKSLEFVKKELWPKVLKREKFSKDEKLFSVFGILAGIWSVCAIGIAIYLWTFRILNVPVEGALRRIYIGLMALVFGIPLLVVLAMKLSSVLHAAFLSLANSERLKINRNLVYLMVGISIVLAAICYFMPESWPKFYREILKLAVLSFALFFAMKNVAYYRKGHLERTFLFLASFTFFLFMADLVEFIGLWFHMSRESSAKLLAPTFRVAAYSLLLLSMATLAGKEFRLCRRSEKMAALAFLIVCSSLTTVAARWVIQNQLWRQDLLSILNSLFPMALLSMALVLLIPGYFVYQRTEFRSAWLALAVSFAGMSAANAFRFYDKSSLSLMTSIEATSLYVFGYSLFASAQASQYVIYKRVRFARTPSISTAVMRYDDRWRLRSAFTDIFEAVFSQFMPIHGRRVTQYIQGKLNMRAKEAGWELEAVYEKIEDNVPDSFSIISLGEIYRGFLLQMFDLISDVAGRAFLDESVQRGWDQLYWEEREVADQYLFSPMERGKKLTEEFRLAKKNLASILQEMAIFSGLSQAEIFLMSSRLRIEKYKAGAEIVRQGELGDKLYIIRSGEVEVSVRSDTDDTERIVAHLSDGEYFGEVALVGDVLRTASCRATTAVEVWTLSKRDFNQFVRSNLDLPEKMDDAVFTMDMLKKMPLFREFKYKQINTISSMLKPMQVPPRTAIIKQGEPGDAFYIIKSGEVLVSAEAETGAKAVGRLGEAEYFGEIALVSNQPRTATVTSMSETELLVLEKSDFDQVTELISPELEQAGSRRLLDTRRKLSGREE